MTNNDTCRQMIKDAISYADDFLTLARHGEDSMTHGKVVKAARLLDLAQGLTEVFETGDAAVFIEASDGCLAAELNEAKETLQSGHFQRILRR